jgi:AraC family transcriptional regulator
VEYPDVGTIHAVRAAILDEIKAVRPSCPRDVPRLRNDSKAMAILHRFTGAIVRRTIDPSRATVAEHAHDWPMLSLYVMGGYRNITECGEHDIAGPSFVFYRRGAAHRNDIGDAGFEQLEIEFDPDWFGVSPLPREPVLLRIGGRGGACARKLAAVCASGLTEEYLRHAVRGLLSSAESNDVPGWIAEVDAALRDDPSRRIGELAGDIGVSAAWIGPAYRRGTGQSIKESAARLRVERAARLLRESDDGLASVAMQTGFCDQSHMNRLFGRVLGRSPRAVRQERLGFRRHSAC